MTLPHGAKQQLLSMISSTPELLQQLRLHLYHWPSMASHNAKPQLLNMTPSCLQNQWETLKQYQVQLQAQGAALAHLNYS